MDPADNEELTAVVAAKKGGKNIIIPDSQYWSNLRAAYFNAKTSAAGHAVDQQDQWLQKVLAAAPDSGALIQYEVRRGEYGRGIYSQQHVPAGTAVWNSEHCGVFRTAQQWRDFLHLLPPHMQYDAVEWAYVEKGEVWLDLEPSAMMNHGGSPIEDEYVNVKPSNIVECVKADAEAKNDATSPRSDDSDSDSSSSSDDDDDNWHYIATCEIQPGDELLCDYSKFHDYAERLPWFEESWEQIVERGIDY